MKSIVKQLDRQYLNDRIVEYKSRGGTVDGLAVMVGISKATIYNHVNGKSCMSVDNLKRTLRALDGSQE